MISHAWLNREDQFAPGEELFRFERHFALEAYTASHSQLLLISHRRFENAEADGDEDPGPLTRVDVLFKPVRALKLRGSWNGLIVRCATEDETASILGGDSYRRIYVVMRRYPLRGQTPPEQAEAAFLTQAEAERYASAEHRFNEAERRVVEIPIAL